MGYCTHLNHLGPAEPDDYCEDINPKYQYMSQSHYACLFCTAFVQTEEEYTKIRNEKLVNLYLQKFFSVK